MVLRQSVLGLFLFFSLLVAGVAFAGEAVSGEVLVVLKNELGAPMTEKLLNGVEARLYVARVASGVDARVACTYGSLSEASDTIFAFFVSDKKTTEQLIAALEKCPEVLAVSPNYRMQTMGGSKVLDVPSKEVNVVKPETEQNVQKPSPGKTVSEDVKKKTEAQKGKAGKKN